jgi:hypothetical protein
MHSISYVDSTLHMTTVCQLSSNRFTKFILLLIFPFSLLLFTVDFYTCEHFWMVYCM